MKTMRTFKIEQTETQYVVTWRHFHSIVFKWIMAVVLLGPLGLFITASAIAEGDIWAILLALALLGLLFWAFFARVVNVLFGKTAFILDKNGLETIWTCLSVKREKWIDLTEIRYFEKRMSYGKWGRWYCQLRVVCNGSNADFIAPAGFLTSASKELDDVCNQLNVFLATLKEPEV